MSVEITSAGPARVLHVVGAMNVGGAETFLMNLYRSIDRDQLQFDFLSYDDEPGDFDPEIEALGGRIFRLPPPRSRGVGGGVRDIRTLLQKAGPFQAVHAHILYASALAMSAAAREGVPIRIAHSHSTEDFGSGVLRWAYRGLMRSMIHRHATSFVACGADAGRYLFGNRPWTLLPNAVDVEAFGPPTAEERARARAEFDVAPGTLLVGAIARLEEVKNHAFLIELARELTHRGVEFQMLFAGDGSLRAELVRQVDAADLADCVSFLGLRQDAPALVAGLDLLLMPSLWEGIPMVLLEAQAAALPALVSDRVSDEVDLGLGLIDFLQIESVTTWADRVQATRPRAPLGKAEHRERIRAAGGDIRDSAATLSALYGLAGSP